MISRSLFTRLASFMLILSYSVRAQPPQGAETCEDATAIGLPFTILNGNLEGQVGGGVANPALTCGGPFDNLEGSPEIPILWYSLEGTGDCACLELRSDDNAFIVGLYDNEPCNSLQCLESTDFTSQILVWSTEAGQSNRIAVSVLPGGPQSGLFSLEVVAVMSGNCLEEDGSVSKVPGSCSDLEVIDPSPISTPSPVDVKTPVPTVHPSGFKSPKAAPKMRHKMKMHMHVKSSKSSKMQDSSTKASAKSPGESLTMMKMNMSTKHGKTTKSKSQ